MAALATYELTKDYAVGFWRKRPYRALDRLSLEVNPGEVFGFLGPNGAGKTTTLKLLMRLVFPTSGRAEILGRPVGDLSVKRRIGYLPENCPAWPEMTVIEFLEYQALLHDVPSERRASAIAAAIRRTALTDKATQSIQTLSRGYRQRVGVAQAILHSPDIIILDEPTNGLDPTQILHMRGLIRELAQSATVIVSTHILQEVQAICPRVLILRAGRKLVDARLDELQQDGRLLVTLDRDEPSARPVLEAIAGVGSVGLLSADSGRYQYALQVDEALTPAVSRAIHEAGLPLYGLQRQQRTLEAVFADVNADAAGEMRRAA